MTQSTQRAVNAKSRMVQANRLFTCSVLIRILKIVLYAKPVSTLNLFMEHFSKGVSASAHVVMLRLLGVPDLVVSGHLRLHSLLFSFFLT